MVSFFLLQLSFPAFSLFAKNHEVDRSFASKYLSHFMISWQYGIYGIPSGKLSHNYGKSPFLMGKLIINGHFQ